jgi:hypothetical protein
MDSTSLPTTENDRHKFVRLATSRVTKAISAIRLLGNLSNRSNYSYTEADVEKIFRALNTELKECRRRFENDRVDRSVKFRLEE